MRSWVADFEHQRDVEAGTESAEDFSEHSLDALLGMLCDAAVYSRDTQDNARENELREYITENF